MEDRIIQDFINVVYENAGKGNKDILAQKIEKEFDLQKKGAIYFCDSFAVRFCSTKSKSESVSNTVMALKHIKSFDNIPLFVCVVGPQKNYLRMANATLTKENREARSDRRCNSR